MVHWAGGQVLNYTRRSVEYKVNIGKKVPDFLYIFGTKMKKEKKYMKMCKNKKYSKGVPYGVLEKNMKYVQHFVGHLIYVPHILQFFISELKKGKNM